MIGLKTKVAVVTGGSSGIGTACVHRLIDEGAFVVVAGRNEVRAKKVCETSSAPERASYVLGDVRRVEDCDRIIQAAIDRHGCIDILVNSAGVVLGKPFMEITEEEWDWCVETNLKGSCFTTQAALRHMLPRKSGVVIYIASDCAHSGEEEATVYCSTKAGLVSLTRSLTKELSQNGIRFVSVSPSVIEGPMTDAWAAVEPDPEAFMDFWRERHPLGRFGRPEEVAAVVAFLASDEAGWVTGCSWLIDGGIQA